MDQPIARVLSIILALSVVLGVVWFVEQDEKRLEEKAASRAEAKRVAIQPRSSIRHDDAARSPAPVERNHKTIYACSNDGQTVISDQPCGNVVATRAARVAPEQVRVRSYREQYDNLVAQRTVTPQATASSSASAVSAQERERVRQAERCAEVHRRIASIDAQARQPQSSRSADRLREQRRLLADERAKVCR